MVWGDGEDRDGRNTAEGEGASAGAESNHAGMASCWGLPSDLATTLRA